MKQITIFGDEVNDEYKNYTHKEKIFLKDAVISMKKNFNNYRLVNFTFGLGRYILSDLVKKFIIDSNWSIAHLDELHLRNTYFINTILWRI